MIKACESGETKVVQLLLERCSAEECGLNVKDKYGWTPFMLACQKGHKDVVKLLLDHSDKIELNARDGNGVTAIMFACKRGHKDVVQLLKEHSDIDHQDSFGIC